MGEIVVHIHQLGVDRVLHFINAAG